MRRVVLLALVLVGVATPGAAHPAPFSYLDVRIGASELSGRLVVHTIDVAHDLHLPAAQALADPIVVREHAPAISALLADRLVFRADGQPVRWALVRATPLPAQDAVEITWRAPLPRPPGQLAIEALLFPYDPNHQTFVNIYEAGELTWQEVLNGGRTHALVFTDTRQGRLAVFRNFTASGVHHIAIGPDHVLFVIGLLLLGGTLRRLLGIVTAFTVGHSVTLALATLDICNPPPYVVEPAIALSIVYVGADNLLAGSQGRDVRIWIALLFGLVHGFGFAGVLREAGLPPRALGFSLFAFNLGVEIGQAAIVAAVAAGLDLLRRHHALLAARVVTAGSLVVVGAGMFWFLERVFQG